MGRFSEFSFPVKFRHVRLSIGCMQVMCPSGENLTGRHCASIYLVLSCMHRRAEFDCSLAASAVILCRLWVDGLVHSRLTPGHCSVTVLVTSNLGSCPLLQSKLVRHLVQWKLKTKTQDRHGNEASLLVLAPQSTAVTASL